MATVLEIVWCKDIQAEETMSQIGQEFTSQKIKLGVYAIAEVHDE